MLIISFIRSQFALHSPNIIFICQTAGDGQNADSVETLRSPSEHVQAQQSLVSLYLYKFNNTSYVLTLVSLFLSVVWCWTWAPVKCPLCLTTLQCWSGWKAMWTPKQYEWLCLRQLHPRLIQPLILGTHASHFILKGKDRQYWCKLIAPPFLWLMVWAVPARVCFLPSPYKACSR